MNLGQTLQLEGEWDEALTGFGRRARSNRDRWFSWHCSAEAAVERELFEEAIACYWRMLEIDSTLAATHNALGWLLQEAGQLNRVGEAPEAIVNTAAGFRDRARQPGRNSGKAGRFRRGRSVFSGGDQGRKRPLAGLWAAGILLRGDFPDADLEVVERRLEECGSSDPNRVNLLFGLASVCDGRRNFARAAGFAREANDLTRAELERRKRRYQPEEHEHLVSGLIETFDRAFFARLSGAGHLTQRPVFIVGLPRSGTTLVEQILASHPQVYGAGELTLVREISRRYPACLRAPGQAADCVRQAF